MKVPTSHGSRPTHRGGQQRGVPRLLASALLVGLVICLSLIAALGGAQGQRPTVHARRDSTVGDLQKGPYLQNVTPNSIVIMWETSGLTASTVRYRPQGGSIWTEVSDSGAASIHEVQVVGLQPGTTYDYQVSQDGFAAWTPPVPPTFRTAPGPDQSYRIVVYGDTRTDYDRHGDVVQAIVGDAPAIVLHTGDAVDHGRDYDEWGEQFFAPAADLIIDTPLFPVLGNHEYAGSGQMWYYDWFSLPGDEQWYAFTYGCARVVGLDTNNGFSPGSEQYDWLESELQSSEYAGSAWQFVFLHHPPYTSGPHPADAIPVEEHLVPLFEQYAVDIVFAGHNHHYERSYKDGIHYIVTGGGGAPLYGFPNVDLNPFSQVREQAYHYVTLDLNCRVETVEMNAWDYEGTRIDGPIALGELHETIYLPLIVRQYRTYARARGGAPDRRVDFRHRCVAAGCE